MTAKTSPLLTREPLDTEIFFTTPSEGEGSAFSIFIASRITIESPALTESPSPTKYRRTIPGIGASSPTSPAETSAAGAEGAGAGAGAGAGVAIA